MNLFHAELLDLIQKNAGKGTSHTSLDSYLGTVHPRYAIAAPALRKIASNWMCAHRYIGPAEFVELLNSLIKGESSTEKIVAGMLMDNANLEQGSFDPKIFDSWLEYLEGWAEVDAVCTGTYTIKQIPLQWKKWKPLLIRFSKDKNIHKRRAALVFFCSTLSHCDDTEIAETALANIERVKHEKEVLITKAVSWLLRSMIRHHKHTVAQYLKEHEDTLPRIAVRETMIKLKTGKKTTKGKKPQSKT